MVCDVVFGEGKSLRKGVLERGGILFQRFIGVALMVVPFIIFAFIVRFWPTDAVSTTLNPNPWSDVWACRFCDELPFEPRMLVIVLLSGALGSMIHTATSYASYVGSRKFVDSWAWWYFLRIPIGMGLATILYFVLRGGFFTPTSGSGDSAKNVVNPFGFAAVASLAGMFSKQATDKLKEVFDGFFRTEEDADRSDKLSNGKPVISKIEPAKVPVSKSGAEIVLTGAGIGKASKVTVNNERRKFQVADAGRLSLKLKSADVEMVRDLEIQVINPDEFGGASDRKTIKVV